MHSCSERKMIIWSLCLILSLSNSILVFTSPPKHLCRPDQKDALWEFKTEFYVQNPELYDSQTEKWRNNTDCCSWDGVSCDPKTGMVIELRLVNSSLSGPLRSNSSLFKLQYLQSLNLESNNLSGILLDSIGNLKYLRVLRLDDCNFHGELPDSIGNLNQLTELHLGSNTLSGNFPLMLFNLSELTSIGLSSNRFEGMLPSNMSSLSKLESFDITGNSFSGSIPPSLFMLPSLVDLDLGRNKFEGMLPSNMSSLSKLESFDITRNSFSGSIPPSLFMLPSLVLLVMRRNNFSGPLEIGNISSPSQLRHLNLGEINFNGPIPGSISKLVGLKYLDLSFWNAERSIVDFNIFLHLKSIAYLYLSYLNTRSMVDLSLFSHIMSLRNLDLTGNNLKISSTLHLPSLIEVLILSSCNISEFPKFLQPQTNISYLDISANQIEGKVPEWLWRLPALQYVNISHNSFSGFEGSSDAIQRSGKLTVLDISSNRFQDQFPLLPKSMQVFLGSDNLFSGEIPRTICKLVSLDILVLSNNNFSGSVPRCFENFNTTLSALHLRNNSLSGILPKEAISVGLKSLDVGRNRLSGELPKPLINCTLLEFLNVEDNIISDKYPFWLRLLPRLQILVLRSNEFHGPISSPGDSLSFPMPRIFDISENLFTGAMPSDYFAGWSAMSSVVDIVDTENSRLFENHNSVALINKGLTIELVWSSFSIYKTIDVSGNRLEGDIPESIGLLKELIVLNMSNNAFTGHIPPSLGNLTNLQSLDLSQNRLSGKIPPELGKLTFIEWMNFSYNRLEGQIPQSTQIQSQNSSSFIENLGLCGAPLQETCGEGEEEATKQEEDEEKEEEDQVLSWIAAAIGYVPGVLCGLTIGHILAS